MENKTTWRVACAILACASGCLTDDADDLENGEEVVLEAQEFAAEDVDETVWSADAPDPVDDVIAALPSTAHPRMFLDQAEIAAIRAKVEARAQPWRDAYAALISAADRARSARGYYSVTKDRGPNGGHNFMTENPYCGWKARDGRKPDCRDGRINDRQSRQDYSEAIHVGRDVRNLGLAYALTGEASYADRAVYLIRRWALDAQTSMRADAWPEGSRKIEVVVTLPGMFYGADLVFNYRGWPRAERDAFVAWVRKAGRSATGWSWGDGNNLESWRTNFIMAAGALADDESLITYATRRFKQLVPGQINATGQMTKELRRTNGLSYSLYAMNAMTQAAEIARHQGIDLYGHTVSSSDRRGLQAALDYHDQFCAAADPRARWRSQTSSGQIEQLPEASCALYELGNARWNESSYRDVLRRRGRPLEEQRIMGPVTLTHARGTYPVEGSLR